MCQSNVFCESVTIKDKKIRKFVLIKKGKERLEADMSKASYKSKKGKSSSQYRQSSLPTLYHEQGYTQSVRGLLGGEARRFGS